MKTAVAALILCLERASATACTCKATWSNSYCSDQKGCPPSTCDSWHTNWCEVEPDGCDGSSYDGTGFYWMECEASPAPTASLAPTVSPAPTLAPSTTAAPSVNLWAGCNWSGVVLPRWVQMENCTGYVPVIDAARRLAGASAALLALALL